MIWHQGFTQYQMDKAVTNKMLVAATCCPLNPPPRLITCTVAVSHPGSVVLSSPGQLISKRKSPLEAMVAGLEAKLLADKGYISKSLFARLWQKGLHLLTGTRKNMRNHLMQTLDKLLLRKRFILEPLFDKLKSEMGLEHTRRRSPLNAFVQMPFVVRF